LLDSPNPDPPSRDDRFPPFSFQNACQQEDHALAAANKSLAQSNKSEADGKATKQRKTEHIEQ